MTWSSLEWVGKTIFNSYFDAVGNIKAKLWIIIAISKWCLNGRSFSSRRARRLLSSFREESNLTPYTQDKDPGIVFHSAFFIFLPPCGGTPSRPLSLTRTYNGQRHSGFQPRILDGNRACSQSPGSHFSTWFWEKTFYLENLSFFCSVLTLGIKNIYMWHFVTV